MHPDNENPRAGIVLGLVMIAGLVLMATQLWDARDFGLPPRLQGGNASDQTFGAGVPNPLQSSAALRTSLPETAARPGDGKYSETTATEAEGWAEAAEEGGARVPDRASEASASYKGARTGAMEPFLEEEPAYNRNAGQQGAVKIPLRADPGIQFLRRGEGEPDMNLTAMPGDALEEAYRKLGSAEEREAFLAELTATERQQLPKILESLFRAERDPVLKESILSAATAASATDQVRGLLVAALDTQQAVDVRLAALYYASDLAPDLVRRYVNDANLDVREEARNLAETEGKP
ncbi:hypothetical protein [Methyloterricola oryzae]|uniref:hypothetical protein n=1 Tax=Methyloterricola oryzae TaxID=1495050 RepID=UPI0005EB82C4|nr:hypothetical protein [Methyloterricola oryzae]